jgi:diguanylate cyclase (GGDEF)-like protein
VKTRLIGAVYLDNPHVAGAFSDQQVEIAELLTDQAAVAIDNALLRIRSIHDGLTGLYNHPHFEKRLEGEVHRARRHGRPCSLLMIDLDDFKEINDTHGHEAGNEVLRNVARMITSVTRSDDFIARVQEKDKTPVVARYGGDEFEVILPETGPEAVGRVAERLLNVAAETDIEVTGTTVKARLSIGAACFPDHASDHRTMILKADEALYAAKRAGKGRFVIYSDDIAKKPKK